MRESLDLTVIHKYKPKGNCDATYLSKRIYISQHEIKHVTDHLIVPYNLTVQHSLLG